MKHGKDTEVEQFYEDLQDILDLKIKKIFFFIEDWHVNVGSQEIPGVTGKLELGVQMKQGKGYQSFTKKTHWS